MANSLCMLKATFVSTANPGKLLSGLATKA